MSKPKTLEEKVDYAVALLEVLVAQLAGGPRPSQGARPYAGLEDVAARTEGPDQERLE